ncbi:hypothetical protein Daesc_008896 [Daldinia eschscholtzii]|uniref:DUF1996 domain-containing protein n=1 Tax=Daldinia eschscholtzii TaxID=292717 RepID=A0AAX6MCZ6_9PEZI
MFPSSYQPSHDSGHSATHSKNVPMVRLPGAMLTAIVAESFFPSSAPSYLAAPTCHWYSVDTFAPLPQTLEATTPPIPRNWDPDDTREQQPSFALSNGLQLPQPLFRRTSEIALPKMQWRALAVALLAGETAAQQMIRFGCSQLVIERLDPLVNPGTLPSPHVHQIVGGNSFNTSMDPTVHDLVRESTCTSCTFSEDFSNYWTAVLYFKARNGTYKRVEQFSNVGLRGVGGITVYYIPPYDGKTKVTAFQPGFRMLVGDAGLRKADGMQRQLCHRCYTSANGAGVAGDSGGAPCTGSDTQSLPPKPCLGGIRTTITFPTCWGYVLRHPML